MAFKSFHQHYLSILYSHFPDHGGPQFSFEYTRPTVEGDAPLVGCSVTLFGFPISTRAAYGTEEAAMEAACQKCIPILSELVHIIFKTNDAHTAGILKSIVDELKGHRADGESPNYALLQVSDAIFGELASADGTQCSSAAVDSTFATNPAGSLYEFARGGPHFECFQRRDSLGCHLKPAGSEHATVAAHSGKTGTEADAARMACAETFGDTSQDVQIRAEQHSLANTLAPVEKVPNEDPTVLSPVKTDSLPNRQKFISRINEYCQKNRLTPPSYTFTTNGSVGSTYVCRVESFLATTFLSAPFSRKIDAKEDVAARIHQQIEEQAARLGRTESRIVRQHPLHRVECQRQSYNKEPLKSYSHQVQIRTQDRCDQRTPSRHHDQTNGHYDQVSGHHDQVSGHHDRSNEHHDRSNEDHDQSSGHHDRSSGHHDQSNGHYDQVSGHYDRSNGHHDRSGRHHDQHAPYSPLQLREYSCMYSKDGHYQQRREQDPQAGCALRGFATEAGSCNALNAHFRQNPKCHPSPSSSGTNQDPRLKRPHNPS